MSLWIHWSTQGHLSVQLGNFWGFSQKHLSIFLGKAADIPSDSFPWNTTWELGGTERIGGQEPCCSSWESPLGFWQSGFAFFTYSAALLFSDCNRGCCYDSSSCLGSQDVSWKMWWFWRQALLLSSCVKDRRPGLWVSVYVCSGKQGLLGPRDAFWTMWEHSWIEVGYVQISADTSSVSDHPCKWRLLYYKIPRFMAEHKSSL